MVVIVHGSQDNNATATVLWDNAFAEPVGWSLAGDLSALFNVRAQVMFFLCRLVIEEQALSCDQMNFTTNSHEQLKNYSLYIK